jgi:hypothetical protein
MHRNQETRHSTDVIAHYRTLSGSAALSASVLAKVSTSCQRPSRISTLAGPISSATALIRGRYLMAPHARQNTPVSRALPSRAQLHHARHPWTISAAYDADYEHPTCLEAYSRSRSPFGPTVSLLRAEPGGGWHATHTITRQPLGHPSGQRTPCPPPPPMHGSCMQHQVTCP